MVTLVRALAAVLFRQLDAAAFHSVDGSDVNAIGPKNFHVLPDFAYIDHVVSPLLLDHGIERPLKCIADLLLPPLAQNFGSCRCSDERLDEMKSEGLLHLR